MMMTPQMKDHIFESETIQKFQTIETTITSTWVRTTLSTVMVNDMKQTGRTQNFIQHSSKEEICIHSSNQST